MYGALLAVSIARFFLSLHLRATRIGSRLRPDFSASCCKAHVCWPSAHLFLRLTKNQIVAGAVGFALALVLWILNWTTSFGNSDSVQVLNYLSIVSHMDSFSRGVIDTKDIVYYLSMIFLGLFLTARSLESLTVEGIMADIVLNNPEQPNELKVPAQERYVVGAAGSLWRHCRTLHHCRDRRFGARQLAGESLQQDL